MNDSQAQPETRRVRFFRWFYHGVLLVLGLWIIDRNGSIVTPYHSIVYWLAMVAFISGIIAWPELTRTPRGQRVLGSRKLERFTGSWIALVLCFTALEIFVRTEFSRKQVFGPWPVETTNLYLDMRGIHYDLNSLGFRDVEHKLEPANGVTRVLLLGDSFTFGQAVAQPDIYPARLRELSGEDVEWIVMARGGASTLDQLGYLRDRGCSYQPDAVVVGVVTNDPHVPSSPSYPAEWRILTARSGNSESYNPHFAYMLDFMLNRLAERLELRDNYSDWEKRLYATDEPWFSDWKGIVRDLTEEAHECGADSLYAVLMPPITDYQDAEVLAQVEGKIQILADVFSEAGFVVINLVPDYQTAFSDRPFRSLWALPNDGHPNAEVHGWFADQIWQAIGQDLEVELP